MLNMVKSSCTRCYRQEGHSPPCTKARRGGRATKKEVAKRPLIARTGWFSDGDTRKTTPSASGCGGFAAFLDDADTPPCFGARRGIGLLPRDRQMAAP